jgi:putative intracellular protease/amidase
VLCVPGGFGTAEAMMDAAFMAQIRRLGGGATYITSVCTGSLILGAAGFLQGKRAACHWAWRAPAGAVRRDRLRGAGGARRQRHHRRRRHRGHRLRADLLAELAGRDYAEAVQLGLEYAPAPPFNSGRPELARPEILAQVRAVLDQAGGVRAEAAAAAAGRMAAA